MLRIKNFYFNDLHECCSVAWDETGECVIIDPGFYTDAERDQLAGFIKEKGLRPVKILLTHGHFDHLFGVTSLAGLYDVPVLMSAEDISIADNSGYFSKVFGVKLPDTSFTAPAEKGGRLTVIKDGDIIEWGAGRKWEVIATPGHTPGGVCFLDREAKLLFSGDTLFAGSIGRTDQPGGDYDVLMKSIFERLMPLDGDIEVIPGHGPCTSITDERTKNPFLLPFNEPADEE